MSLDTTILLTNKNTNFRVSNRIDLEDDVANVVVVGIVDSTTSIITSDAAQRRAMEFWMLRLAEHLDGVRLSRAFHRLVNVDGTDCLKSSGIDIIDARRRLGSRTGSGIIAIRICRVGPVSKEIQKVKQNANPLLLADIVGHRRNHNGSP
jgi:hypothetical protein